MIYLDHAASTFPYLEACNLYKDFLPEHLANPSAAHRLAFLEEQKIKQAKQDLAKLLNCKADNLTFTSGATEAVNTAIKGYFAAHAKTGNKLIISAGEHAAVRETASYVAQLYGKELVVLRLDSDGRPCLEHLAEVLDEDTAMLAVLSVNNETGAVSDVAAMSALLKARASKAVFLLDCAQQFCKQVIDLKALDVDFACFAGHKVHALKNSGLLYVRTGLRIIPLLHGGGQQTWRSGTEDSLAAQSLALAATLGHAHLADNYAKVSALKTAFIETLDPTLFVLNSPPTALPWIVNISFPGVRAETLLHSLAAEEVYVSQASACHSKAPYSHVLVAMNLSKERLESALRISFDASQSIEEVQAAAVIINSHAAKLNLRKKRPRDAE